MGLFEADQNIIFFTFTCTKQKTEFKPNVDKPTNKRKGETYF